MLGTAAFLSLARATAATHGLPHLPVAVVPHPIGGMDPAGGRSRAEAIADAVLDALTRDPASPAEAAPSEGAALAVAPEDLDAFQAWAGERGWSDERARVPLASFSAENLARFAVIAPAVFADRPPGTTVGSCYRAEDVMIVVAGGPGKRSAFVPTFGATRAVTVRVDEPV